ncbi:MAG: PAS domain S-box protein [Desulfobacterales bacterium]
MVLRIGLSLVGITVLVLQSFKRFHRYNLLFLLIIIAYIEIANGLITGLTKADPFYLGRYIFLLTLLALVPIHRLQAWSILAVSLLVFFISGFTNGMHFNPIRLHYGLNNLLVSATVVTFFIYLLDKIRFSNWEKSIKIKQQNELLKSDKAKIDELLQGIRLSEAKYRQLFDRSPIGIFLTTAEGKVITANRAILDLLKFESVEAINIMGLPNLYVDLKDRAALWEKLKSGPVSGYETVFRRADGELISVSIGGYMVYDEEGNASFLEGTIEDITERKRAEETLRRSDEQYRQIVENASDCISRVNDIGIFTFVNPAFEKLLGYSIGDIQGHSYWEIIPDDYKKKAIEFFQDMSLRQIKETYFEFPGITKSGETIWFGQISRRQELPGGEIEYLCISRDITERKLMEAALRDSENKYRFLIENSIDIIWTLDLKTMAFSFVSNSVEPILGYSSEESVGKTIDFIFSRETIKSLITAFGNIIGDTPTADRVFFEAEHIAKDGRKVWMEINAVVQKDETGKPAFLNGISRDITERKRTDAALQASEEKFRQIVNSIPYIVSILDMNLRLTYVSDSVQRILGYTPEEAMTLTLDQIFTPESLAIAFKSFQERLEANAKGSDPNYVLILELEEYHKNGSTVFLENTMTFLRDANGAPLSILCVAADITERKHSEQAIRESERRLADVIDFLPLATMVIDREGRVSSWNRAMEIITGVNRADILGKGDYEYSIPFYGERRPILIDMVFASKEDLATKYSYIRREQGILTAEAFVPQLGIILVGYATELHDSEGKVVGAIESVYNITDIRRVEEELKEAKMAADAANRAKSAFLANMSHEIRTPMNAILGFAQLMERDPMLSAESREHLEIINRSGEHLLELINEILEMSKIEAGRATFVPNTFDLHALLHDIERMFRIRTEARGFRFLVEKVGHLPRWVVTDEGKLRQVLINLLGNAVKFTEEGGIALRLRAKDGKADTTDLQFEVEDTGPGMSEEEIGRLFQAFEQTSAGIRSGGTGLGLSLSRGFVQIMGGSISVASTIGKGTTFQFEIPVREGKEEEASLEESKRRVLHLSPGQREIRVLIADDRETNRQLLSRLLAAAGFTTREVVNGEESVHMVSEWKPQVVLMDMTMPVMDGYEATRRIKSSPDISNTAIIAVTASAFEEDRQRILAAGADGFLAKPFKEKELFENIARLTGAEYLYQEEGSTEKPPRIAEDAAEMRRIAAALPPDLVGQLLSAVERADLDRLNDLAGQLATDYPFFAQRIHEMAVRYQYEELIDLFSQGA